MRALRRWVTWEMSRSIEVTGFITFIIVERFIKGSLLVLGGIAIIVLASTVDLHDYALRLQSELALSPGRHVFRSVWEAIVDRFGGLHRSTEDAIGVGAVLYGLLDVVEGLGLLRRRRWAEYLVLIATGVFLPLEIDEVLRHVTPLKLLALLVNIAIVVYLVWRKRLFLERPRDELRGAPA